MVIYLLNEATIIGQVISLSTATIWYTHLLQLRPEYGKLVVVISVFQ